MDKQFASYRASELELLSQGRYKEWFWAGLDHAAIVFLRTGVRDQAKKACGRCGEVFLRVQMHVANDGFRCHGCWLNNNKQAGKWNDRTGSGWMKDGACVGADTEIFFPQNRNIAAQPDAPWRAYCSVCTVTGTCKLYAADSSSGGVWGGEYLKTAGDFDVVEGGTGKIGRPSTKPVIPCRCSKDVHDLLTEDDLDKRGWCRRCANERSRLYALRKKNAK